MTKPIYEFAFNTPVWVTTPELDGRGLVKGVQAEYPVVGVIYIVEMTDRDQSGDMHRPGHHVTFKGLPNETYPYNTICLPQGCLRRIV